MPVMALGVGVGVDYGIYLYERIAHEMADGSLDEFDAIMGVNVKGVWLCMKHQLPLLLAQGGGAIVNTASVAGLRAAQRCSAPSRWPIR